MSQADVLDDRLPWLPNEPVPPRERSQPEIAAMLIAAALLVIGAAYWLLQGEFQQQRPAATRPAASTTIALPRAKAPAPPRSAPQDVQVPAYVPMPAAPEPQAVVPSTPERQPLVQPAPEPDAAVPSTPRASRSASPGS